MYKFTVYTQPQAKEKSLRRLCPPLFICMLPPICSVKFNSDPLGMGMGGTSTTFVLRGPSNTAAVWGPGEPKTKIMAENLRHRQTFSSRRWRYTWKGSICGSTLLEMIISVNWLRHSAYQCRADTLYVTEIRSPYCRPIKTHIEHTACCTVHSAMQAACFSNRLHVL